MHHVTVVRLPGIIGTHLRSEATRKGPATPPRISSRRKGGIRISWRIEGGGGGGGVWRKWEYAIIYIWIPMKDNDSYNFYTSDIYISRSTIKVCVIFQHSYFQWFINCLSWRPSIYSYQQPFDDCIESPYDPELIQVVRYIFDDIVKSGKPKMMCL